jgi:ATP phosphoribosyltransferase
MEIAPALDLAPYIVDLVSTGGTLKANGLRETETILQVSSRLVVNRTAIKTRPEALGEWVENFRKAAA